LPSGMPSEVVSHLKKTRICGRPLNIEDINSSKGGDAPRRSKSKDGQKGKDARPRSKDRKPAKRSKAKSAE